MADVHISVEKIRGCGYRKPSAGGKGVGIYLVADGIAAPCGKLPIALDVCPCCGGGIKQSRPSRLFAGVRCNLDDTATAYHSSRRHGSWLDRSCESCPLGDPLPEGKHGLIWIGESFYATPDDFRREAAMMGVSRKLPAIPRGFDLGQTWVYLAHPKAVQHESTHPETAFTPGIFRAFMPTGVDLVIEDEDKIPERAEKLLEQIGDGARLVKVIPERDAQGKMTFDGATP
jgi:hypothetical protein